MTNMTALENATWVHSRLDSYDKQQRFDAAVELGEWGVFSFRQIGAIVGLSHSTVRKLVSAKSDRTGGTFSPECLEALLDISRRRLREEEVDPQEVRDMLTAGSGTSAYVAAKLGGISESWLRRRRLTADK